MLKKLIKNRIKKAGYKVIKQEVYDELLKDQPIAKEFEFLLHYSSENISNYIKYRDQSKAQLGQDLFILLENDFKKNGFFVEFGATDGISLSNSYLLEKNFGWKGILAEPSRFWHEKLKANRSAFIEEKCVWIASGKELLFNEASMGSLSTIASFSKNDLHKNNRKEGKKYNVKTISLLDLLDTYNAPKHIDFLSVDTEGSEYEILNNFDFTKYTFGVITVEHNYTDLRENIYTLLSTKGYVRKYENYSKFDDWYVLKTSNSK
jgi:FkbM family methyltransferase